MAATAVLAGPMAIRAMMTAALGFAALVLRPAAAQGLNEDLGLIANPPEIEPGWYQGRATFFDAPDYWKEIFNAFRGDGSYGDLHFAHCGYTEKRIGDSERDRSDMPFPIDGVAAVSDRNPDYPGSCGRCYEVRCLEGPVFDVGDEPISTTRFFHQPNFAPDTPDTQGRLWPGVPDTLEDPLQQYVRCWDAEASVVVRIIDKCPCFNPEVNRTSFWCCGSQMHFDLSFWAFEKLAHPIYGVMTTAFRPVDCDTAQPLDFNNPGSMISRTVYRDGPQPGWAWRKWFDHWSYLLRSVTGVAGLRATCASVSPQGGVSFMCNDCGGPGFQPFAGVEALSFWVRPDSNTTDSFATATPRGQPPPLKLFALNQGEQQFCRNSVFLEDLEPAQISTTEPDWYQYIVPMSLFDCPDLANVNRVAWQNDLNRDAQFCLDEIVLE